jgi:hypothetical protein
MPGSHRVGFAADPGGPGAAGGASSGTAAPVPGGNPLVLAALLGAVAAAVRLAWCNGMRSRVSRYTKGSAAKHTCFVSYWMRLLSALSGGLSPRSRSQTERRFGHHPEACLQTGSPIVACRVARGLGTHRACAVHAALACTAAVLLAVACHLAPPSYARTGSGLGVVEGLSRPLLLYPASGTGNGQGIPYALS